MSRAYLADTHVVIWSWHDSKQLSKTHVEILQSDATVLVSVATIWEISIKASLGKLKTTERVAERLAKSGYEILAIRPEHAEAVRHLPLHHKDPFDRMLIAQAQAEGLTLLSADRNIRLYDVDVI